MRGGLSNGQLTEDEALARALQASISDQQSGQQQQAQDQQITAPQTRYGRHLSFNSVVYFSLERVL